MPSPRCVHLQDEAGAVVEEQDGLRVTWTQRYESHHALRAPNRAQACGQRRGSEWPSIQIDKARRQRTPGRIDRDAPRHLVTAEGFARTEAAACGERAACEGADPRRIR